MGFWSDLMGGDSAPPTGTLDDAWRMLQAGAVNDGRQLLLAICRSDPSNRPAHALGVLELTRPPFDQSNRSRLIRVLDSQPAPASQPDFVLPFLAMQQLTIDATRHAYETFIGSAWTVLNVAPPSSPHIAAMMLYTRVFLSDCLIQVSLPPASGKIDSAIVNVAVAGIAQLVLRDARALATLQRGSEVKADLSAYSELAGRKFSAREDAALSRQIALASQIGLGLAHRDSGRKEQARAAFQAALATARQHHPKAVREIDPLVAEMLRPLGLKESEPDMVDPKHEAAIWRSPIPALELLLREP